MSYSFPSHYKGLSTAEVAAAQKKHGKNIMPQSKTSSWKSALLTIVQDPLLILLFAVTAIYFLVQDYAEAIFMLVAIIVITAISFYQDNRSRKALKALQKLNEPLSLVIRNGETIAIPSEDLVIGDWCITEEGKMINADGYIIHSHDFAVNEAALTGESYVVFKDKNSNDNKVYSGTLTTSGLAIFIVEKIGKDTTIGKIGSSLQQIKEEKSPLHLQIIAFVKKMTLVGFIIFLLVCIYSYWKTQDYIQSLLSGLTLAMSILPEEIPVAFSSFMALGAWKLMREGIIIKRSSLVETLGSTTVICTDKTGTITAQKMELKKMWLAATRKTYNSDNFHDSDLSILINYAQWSSEPVPFDPMEQAIHKIYEINAACKQGLEYELCYEYPLAGQPPMMTHILKEKNGGKIVATKGAVEAIITNSRLTELEKSIILDQAAAFGEKGYRVLGVAKADLTAEDYPKEQTEFDFDFLGLLVFYDPPKPGIEQVFQSIYEAGIAIKVITGDNATTTQAIAEQAGIHQPDKSVDGKSLMQLSSSTFDQKVKASTIFTRMFPDAKLKVVQSLKENGEIVAMLGDGVNDGPALKAAHIGVAMGNKGTEIAKAAAAMVITNDDLGKLLIGIAAGRRIYANIKKAVQYIIAIHIPIVLIVALPLFLGWVYPQIFSPVHVIFMELIMGPICSIVYEREALEANAMKEKPRPLQETFLSGSEFILSLTQGLSITIAVLAAYQISVFHGGNERQTRAFVFTTLILSNLLLSYSNRSHYFSILTCFKKKNNLLLIISIITVLMLILILYVPIVSQFFELSALSFHNFSIATLLAIGTITWFELYKFLKRNKHISLKN